MNYQLTDKDQITLDHCLKEFEKTHSNNKRKAINCNIRIFATKKSEYRRKNKNNLNWEENFYSSFDKETVMVYNYLQYIYKEKLFEFTKQELNYFN